MEAIILAGGFGTRLQGVVKDVPKPMADVNGRPFLEYVLDDLIQAGFKHAVLSVGYKHEIIMNHFGSKYKDLDISYAIEEEPLGTGGAIRFTLKIIKSDYFFVLNGDTLFRINYQEMIHPEPIVMALKYLNQNDRYGQVTFKNGYVSSFIEKGSASKEGYINGGIYRFHRAFLESLMLPKKFSLEKDVLEKHVFLKPIKGVSFDAYFIDMGIPEDYQKLKEDLLYE
ncbi:Glucose-1-phosphate cytidylyltransferase [Acholeplasma oculi]|uniref:nucleotidyltransferase family protein n=1 Tax=Acholeplasma oculi TaxID=35623 RepID=UPI000E11CB3C|nr:nucleotidyltransferase family protein [Acholeplasma oculi]SUT89199.1 Glucose-1-phosphate cytidylyltransferase [Acholeplasma oculi]